MVFQNYSLYPHMTVAENMGFVLKIAGAGMEERTKRVLGAANCSGCRPVPMFGGRMSRETDVYYRLEVFAQTGSEGYDLMGLTKTQVIDDVLDRFEAHLGFLAYSSETDAASVLTPPRPATGLNTVVPPKVEDVEKDLDE